MRIVLDGSVRYSELYRPVQAGVMEMVRVMIVMVMVSRPMSE
jgi:hypothetical protein